jgi:hypothetical protein
MAGSSYFSPLTSSSGTKLLPVGKRLQKLKSEVKISGPYPAHRKLLKMFRFIGETGESAELEGRVQYRAHL